MNASELLSIYRRIKFFNWRGVTGSILAWYPKAFDAYGLFLQKNVVFLTFGFSEF